MMYANILSSLQSLEGPSRDVDIAIARCIGGVVYAQNYTGSLDAARAALKALLPGWNYRIAECCVSDDAWVTPDFNHPVYGAALIAEWPEECQRDPVAYLGTDVDRRPPGNPAIALLESVFIALSAQDKLRP